MYGYILIIIAVILLLVVYSLARISGKFEQKLDQMKDKHICL